MLKIGQMAAMCITLILLVSMDFSQVGLSHIKSFLWPKNPFKNGFMPTWRFWAASWLGGCGRGGKCRQGRAPPRGWGRAAAAAAASTRRGAWWGRASSELAAATSPTHRWAWCRRTCTTPPPRRRSSTLTAPLSARPLPCPCCACPCCKLSPWNSTRPAECRCKWHFLFKNLA